MGAARFCALTGSLALLCVAGTLALLTGCGSGESCEQDYISSDQVTTSQNPYRISYLSSNLNIGGIRWENVTTGISGTASITLVNECVGGFLLPRFCGDWSRVTMDIPLALGLNTVHTYERDGDCEWRSDYLITLQ